MRGLADKRVIIAGGGAGIGEATCLRLAAEGARVAVGDINTGAAEDVAGRIRAGGGDAIAIPFDLADEQSTANLVQRAVDHLGGIDGLTNVGADLSPATIGADLDVADMDVAIWLRTLRVNMIGYACTCREAIRVMARQQTGGSIVNVTSESANCGEDTRPAYQASKAGINALTRQIALRWGRDNIRCNAVAPGIVLSETHIAQASREHCDKWIGMTTLARAGVPDELAATITFLLSDDTAWVSGQVWHVNGGSHFHG
jgi:NAD(P)-dependent dehydrogenase (short-subunit alcohol dehydrogenase family)